MNTNMVGEVPTKDSEQFKGDCGHSTQHLLKVREDIWVGGDGNPRDAEQEATWKQLEIEQFNKRRATVQGEWVDALKLWSSVICGYK